MMKKKRRWVLWFFFFILSAGITYLWWTVIQFYRDYRNIPTNHLIGNKSSTVAALKEQGLPFSFLVIGDTRTSETAETLIEKALEKGNPSFIIFLGDFVRKPDIWNHRFFLTEMTAESRPPLPVFLVPGNHDIDYKLSSHKERRMTPAIYDSLYGARNFNFVFNHCLFIICGIDQKKPSSYLVYLRDTLLRKGGGMGHIFIFIHVPPRGLVDYIDTYLPETEKFFSLIEDYKVTTCFFGDYHGYWRGERKGVTLIVSGGGGEHLNHSQWGEFHHILRVTVGQDQMGEEIITIRGQIGLEDRF